MFLLRNAKSCQRTSVAFGTILALLLLSSTGDANEEGRKSLLILHSYHPASSWTDSIRKGMQEALTKSGEPVQLHVEYMDTRRYSGQEYREKMEALLFHKLANEHFDLVLLSDNDALDFLLTHRKRIAPNVPIIFCGINNFSEAVIAGHRSITGVAEEVSLHETIVTALKLHPGTKEIFVIGRTVLPADRANREAFLSLLHSFKQSVKFTFWDDLSANELRTRLPSLQRGSLVFINGLTSDAMGRQLLYDETTRLIRASSNIPLYSLWDVYLGYGIVGGKLVSGHLQGKLAGELAVRVLRGEDPDQIPVLRSEAANKFIFDYPELSRFGLSVKDLPAGSEVIRTPSSFYAINKIYVWTGIVSLLIFSGIIVLLGINILARKRAEEAARRLADEKAVMAEIGRIISSTLNIDGVYLRVVEEARKLILFDGMAINIIHHKEGLVTVPHVSGLGVPGCQPGDTFALAGSATGEAAQRRSGLIIPLKDRNESPARFPTLSTAFEVGIRTLIVVPLLSKDQAIGAIHFRSTQPNAYSEQDLKLAERIADQIAGAVANAQLFSERKRAEEALHKIERRFSVFMEHLPAAVFIKDPSGRLLFANRHLQEIFDWKDCVGKTTEELLPREIAERMIADDRRILTEGPLVIQERIIDIRGVEYFFDTYKFPIPAEGDLVLLGGISVDNTQRIKAERELANTKVLLQSAFEQTPVPMVLASAPDGVILNVNQACIEMLGVEDEGDPVGQSLNGFHQTWQDLDPEGKEVPRTELPLALALQGVTTRNRALSVLRKDGSRRWEMINAAPIYNEAGEMIAAFAVFPDITAQKRTEEALRESEAKYRRLHETMMDAFVHVDMAGHILEANRAYQAMVGYSEDELRRLTYIDLTPEKWHAPEGRIIQEQILVQGHSEVYEKEYRRKDGTIFPVELRTFLIRDEGGNPLGMWAIVRDITERKRAEEALRTSEVTYREIFNTVSETIWIHDINTGKFIDVNNNVMEMFGYPVREALDLTVEDISSGVPPFIQKTAVEFLRKAAGGDPQVFEWHCKHKDGHLFWSEVNLKRGTVAGKDCILALERDITERKRAEEALRESAEQYRIIASTTLVGFAVVDVGGRLLDVNETYCHMLGYSKDELLQMSIRDIEATETPDRIEARIQRIIETGSDRFESRHSRKDGRIIDVEISLTFMRQSDRSLVFLQDITERKRAVEALRQSEKQYRSVIENIQDVFYRSDPEGSLLMSSPSGAKMFGYDTINEMIGLPLESFWLDLKDREPLLAQIKTTGSVKDFEAVLKRKDGTPFNASFTTHFYYDDNGNFLGTEGIIRDITERKRAEEERSKLEAQMREVQKLESLGVLAGGIAHDFNNLLMAILGNADLALLSLSPASPARHNIEEVVNASQRAADLCRQMLAYSGKGRFVLGRHDLSEIVREMAHILQVSVSKKAVMRYRFTESLPPVEADATQLRQVVMNLITNASDALGDENGSIQVSSGVMECDRVYLSESYLDDNLPEGRYVYLEVSDTGCGMDAETRSRIFDPFFTTKLLGRGLGLAAVLGIVRGHKGAIKVYSEPGQGTTFKILFPAVDWTPADRTQIAEQSTPPPLGGTVLLVDDDESVLNVASMMLERLGFTVLTASDGQKGLEVFRERATEIDCVLLDLSMPRLSGDEVFREMRRIRSDVRVILSSGYNEHEVTQRFVGQGLAGFVQKPYTLEKLREILRNILG
jgi:two-component system, cell cycle sensor histidine kinase and response regulator CckA